MEYVNILSLVLDSDLNTTKEYTSLFEDVPTQFFVDSNLLSDTPITNKTADGRYVSIYKDDDFIYLEYFTGSKGSIKSCTQKTKLQFSTHVYEEMEDLKDNTLTSSSDDLDQYIWCMEATIYDLKRDNVDFNQIIEKEKYSVSYHLRKLKNNHFFLESKIWLPKPKNLTNERVMTEGSLFYDIAPTFQRIIKGEENLTPEERQAELEEINLLFENDCDDEFDNCDDFSL